MQYGRSGSVGGSIPPGPVSLGQLCLSMCLLSFPRRSLMDQLSFRFTFPFFCMYRMRLSLFWVHFRPHCRSVDLSCISCAFVLRFRSSECTACVYHSFECTFGPTVARSVFQFHSKKGLLGALVLRPLSLGRSLMDLLLLLLLWLLLLLILRSSLTQSACAQFLEANFPKNLLLFWENWRIQT